MSTVSARIVLTKISQKNKVLSIATIKSKLKIFQRKKKLEKYKIQNVTAAFSKGFH